MVRFNIRKRKIDRVPQHRIDGGAHTFRSPQLVPYDLESIAEFLELLVKILRDDLVVDPDLRLLPPP